MRDNKLKQRKRRDLYVLYKKGLEEGRFSSMRDAGSYLCRQPAPCFYISPESATLLIGRILANQSLIDLNSSTRRMAWRLYQDYKNYLSTHPNTKRSRVSIMNELVDQPAPEFYMTSEAIRRMLREEINEARKKWWE